MSTRPPRVLQATCVLVSLALAACGGGAAVEKTAAALVTPTGDAASAVATAGSDAASGAASSVAAAPAASQAAAAAPLAKAQSVQASGAQAAAGPTVKAAAAVGTANVSAPAAAMSAAAPGSPTPPTNVATVAPAAAPALDATLLGAAATMTGLQAAATNVTATTTTTTANTNCKVAYAPPASLTWTSPAPRPASGGIFYSNAELAVWKGRLSTGPFLKANDFTKGSPGDWDRINVNAADFIKNGDKGPQLTSATDEFGRLGSNARDAAFLFLMTADGTAFNAVRSYLLAQVKNAAVNFPERLCLTDNSNWNPDGYFFQASWLLRYAITYDFVRNALGAADRVTVENFIRRNAYMLATQMDANLANVFPNRLAGDYSKRIGVASAPNGAVSWSSRRFDTNGDCKVDGSDNANAAPVYTYARADGSPGPRITELSQFYNNRRAAIALTFGAAGVMLGDPVLISSAKRYTFEWLTYGVWPDGSQGEYLRNGDYCIPQQGVIYSASNTTSAALLAALLTRQGDTSIQNFSTKDGLFGTESVGGAPAKTLTSAIQTQLGLINGSVKWYFYKPWLAGQKPTEADAMTGFRSYYMKSVKPLENYHELGLLPAAKILPSANIAGLVLRDKSATNLPFPGATGNSVTTGWGTWNDPFNALPAPLLMRP